MSGLVLPQVPRAAQGPFPALLPGAAPRSELALSAVLGALRRIRCTVYARSLSNHVLQIYTGLYALHAARLIELSQRFGARALGERLGAAPLEAGFASRDLNGVFVDVEGAGLAFFDVRDSGTSYGELAEHVTVYAKRGYQPGAYPRPEIFIPMGLNYAVHPDRTLWPELVRSFRQLDRSCLAAKRLAISLARLHPSIGRLLDVPTVSMLSGPVDRKLAPRAIFLARTWDPDEIGAPPAVAEAVHGLNQSRAACIRALRRRFGPRFFGGFSRSPHALQHFPDCAVAPEVSTRRHDYVRRLKSYPICVATTGLFESIGWKFAEYVALSRAIVTEPMRFELPGPMAAGENYLEFRSAEECCDRVAALFDDRELAWRMMEKNRRYYLEYGSPEAVVGRVLHAALRIKDP
jgi:hypothetical protein